MFSCLQNNRVQFQLLFVSSSPSFFQDLLLLFFSFFLVHLSSLRSRHSSRALSPQTNQPTLQHLISGHAGSNHTKQKHRCNSIKNNISIHTLDRTSAMTPGYEVGLPGEGSPLSRQFGLEKKQEGDGAERRQPNRSRCREGIWGCGSGWLRR